MFAVNKVSSNGAVFVEISLVGPLPGSNRILLINYILIFAHCACRHNLFYYKGLLMVAGYFDRIPLFQILALTKWGSSLEMTWATSSQEWKWADRFDWIVSTRIVTHEKPDSTDLKNVRDFIYFIADKFSEEGQQQAFKATTTDIELSFKNRSLRPRGRVQRHRNRALDPRV